MMLDNKQVEKMLAERRKLCLQELEELEKTHQMKCNTIRLSVVEEDKKIEEKKKEHLEISAGLNAEKKWLEIQIERLREECIKTEKNLTERQERISRREKEIEEKEKELCDKEKELSQKEKQLIGIAVDNLTKTDEIKEQEIKLRDFKKQLEEKRRELDEREAVFLEKYNEQLCTLEQKNGTIKVEKNKVKVEKEVVNSKEENLKKREEELTKGEKLLDARRKQVERLWQTLNTTKMVKK